MVCYRCSADWGRASSGTKKNLRLKGLLGGCFLLNKQTVYTSLRSNLLTYWVGINRRAGINDKEKNVHAEKKEKGAGTTDGGDCRLSQQSLQKSRTQGLPQLKIDISFCRGGPWPEDRKEYLHTASIGSNQTELGQGGVLTRKIFEIGTITENKRGEQRASQNRSKFTSKNNGIEKEKKQKKKKKKTKKEKKIQKKKGKSKRDGP